MYLTGLGTSVPKNSYSQAEGWEALQQAPQYPLLDDRAKILMQRVLTADNGMNTRHLALDSLDEAFTINPDILQARFAKHAPLLATQAVEDALLKTGLKPEQIDAIIISTCTGYLCPGLTSYVAERLHLRPDVICLDLVGQGCGAALPNFRTAEALLTADRAKHVLSVCVEVCSAAMYIDNDPGVLISACLFGDGASAAVFSKEPAEGKRKVKWMGAETLLVPEDRDYLRFEHRNGMLRNILSREVPVLAGKHVQTLLSKMLKQYGLQKQDIAEWVLHAGGREVLTSLQKKLELSANAVAWSAEVLREYGNISSPCVMFVLEKALAAKAPGGWWWISTFGAGFSCHGAFLKVD